MSLLSGVVTFSDDGYVVRSGKVFELGNYAEKQFSLNETEADAAIAGFTEAPIDFEHTPTVLSGKLGALTSLRRDGNSLFGDVRLPKWLDDVLGVTERKVSAMWNKSTKRLEGLALVLDPHIPDAAVFSAYAEFAGKRNNATDAKDIQAIHDHSAGLGAACDVKNVQFSKEQKPMSFKDKVVAWMTGGMPDEFEDTPAAAAASPSPVAAAGNPEADALRTELVAERTKRTGIEAAAFAASEIAANRATPAEEAGLVKQYGYAVEFDALRGAAFSADNPESAVATFKAAQAARTPHELTAELLTGNAAIFGATQDTPDPTQPKPASPERIKDMLGMTPLGQSILNSRKN